ncbi:hypothetical protein [Amycolatopsis sp. SID8362]|uniref:hypothetical protein n=1 Tax=Amycolatopsis sp. SID8362 TaxID=2690346 RepID=UPI00136F997A|nr:hypothetical protein [Amycolatopsis sp. SID8362]NBH01737.1 hypothetical protein [Amycolatopsis sp. SID8362]NED38438.1 hypothetical protein [Amycolatopsis sp. SID8362]
MLVAEVLCTGIAQVLGLPVPRLVEADLDAAFGRLEGDPEIQELLRASTGPNLGVDFLPGALDYSARAFPVDPASASRVLWFDALTNNVDRAVLGAVGEHPLADGVVLLHLGRIARTA